MKSSNKKIFILAGSNKDLHWNAPRHLIKVNNEPIIHRTQRLLHEMGQNDITICCEQSMKSKYIINNNQHKNSKSYKDPEESIIWTYRDYIDGNKVNVILYGDCYYTEDFIDNITKDCGTDWKLYSSSDPPETFGWLINLKNNSNIIQYSKHVSTITKKLKLPTYKCYWGDYVLYKLLIGVSPRKINKDILKISEDIEDIHWFEVSNDNYDFDYPN